MKKIGIIFFCVLGWCLIVLDVFVVVILILIFIFKFVSIVILVVNVVI